MSEGGRVRRKRKSRIPVRQPTGLYVHSSPPTVLPVHPSIVRQWLRGGEVGRLQDIVLKKKVQELHDAARAGDVDQVDAIVKSESRINLELSRDSSGTGILHKAVIHGHVPLQDFLLKNYPKTIEVLDRERRNPLHYAAGNEEVWNRLVAGGADTTTVDREGFSPAFYMNHPRRLRPPAPESRSKVPTTNQGLVVKPSNIRIWIHDKDLGRLQKVLWEGLGDKLKTETSSQPLVRRFLNAVPYIMGLVRDVHSAAVNNDLELLQLKSADPVPKDLLLSKDSNGLNPLHKAAGLGHMEVARAIIERAPDAVNAKDHQDRTPLHYAAALKDQNQMYQMLVDYDATDHLEDKKGNTPSHYRAKPSELEGPKLLHVIPDAPRTAHIFPPSWDWRLLTGESSGETPITSPPTEAPPRIPKTQPKDLAEPKSESPPEEPEVNSLDVDKPPEIEPSPDEDEKNIEQEETKMDDAPAVSEDEGVGSEANPSVENTSTPLSDTVNEDEEISGARLGETVTLSSSLFRSQAPRIEEFGNGNDSGNEEGEAPDGKVTDEENGEVEPSMIRGNSAMDDPIHPGSMSNDQPDDSSADKLALANGKTEEVAQTETTLEQTDGSVSNSPMPMETASPNIQSRPNTSEQTAQPGNADGEEEVSAPGIGENLDTPIPENATLKEDDASTDGTESHTTNQTTLQSLDSTFTKIPAVDDLAVNENSFSELPLEGNTAVEADEGISSQLPEERDTTSRSAGDNNETDKVHGETETSTEQDHLESTNNQNYESKCENDLTETEPETEPQDRPHGDEENDEDLGISADLEGTENQNPEESQQIGNESAEPGTPERESKTPIKDEPDTADAEPAEEEAVDERTGAATGSATADGNSEDGINDPSISEPQTGEVEETGETPVNVGETEDKRDSSLGDEKEPLDQPITLRSAGGSRAEVLAITPAPPEEDDILEDDQKAVAEGNTEADRAVAEELVAAGDMEKMAEMVLNGKGAAFLNQTSNNADVQLFINNIPQYIAKIERVHTAAREGDLRGVQTALDRRKFAVARDNNTPLKPTPLHVAALFGRTSVLRYLAGRFPETMHAQDAGGRTALHYAATLPDNGHFYSLLITLGADKSVIDNEGRTAEHYLRNKGELTRDELLNEYQNRPVPIDTTGLNFNRFSDKVENDQVSSRKDVDDLALLAKLDACLRLVRLRAPGTLLNRVLQDDVYAEMKLRSTRLDNSLLDVIAPGIRDIAMGKSRLESDTLFTGLSAPDYESYQVFEEIFLPSIREVNGVDGNDDTPTQPPKDFFGSEGREFFLKMNIDPSGMILKSFTVEITRNLQVATLPKNLKLSELEKVEVALSAVLTFFYRKNKENAFVDDSGENFGSYYSLSEVNENKDVFDDLEQEELVAEGMNEPMSETWPYGRGVFVSPFGDVAAWVNVRDHLKLYSITSQETSGAVGTAYTTAADIVDLLEEKMEPKRHSKLGYLTTDPAYVGTGLRFKSLLNVPHLSQDRLGLRQLCKAHGLVVKPARKLSHYRVYSTVCLGFTEVESFKKYVESLKVIIEAEREHMKGTIAQIPLLIKTLLSKKAK